MLLLQMPSLSRKQGSRTTDSSESCLMMLLILSVFRFWKWSWSRSCLNWLADVGLPRLVWPARPGSDSQPLARSKQQLQQSKPMGERHSSFDIRSSSPTWESDSSRDRFSSTCFQVIFKRTSLLLKPTKCARCYRTRSFCELVLLDCVCTHTTQVFMSRGCLFSGNDAAGMRFKENPEAASVFLLIFFLLTVPCPALSLPLCVHTVQTAREEVEEREEQSFWLVKHADQLTNRSCLLSPQHHNEGGAKLGRE